MLPNLILTARHGFPPGQCHFFLKRDTPTVLMKTVDAEMELAEGLLFKDVAGEAMTAITVKCLYIEVNQCGPLLRPRLPDMEISKVSKYGPRKCWNASVAPSVPEPIAEQH